MKVLLIKTTSLGDVVHTFPALSDAQRFIPDLSVDWVVEGTFADLPALHPAVDQIISVRIRHWRKHWIDWIKEWPKIRRMLSAKDYDVIIDAQGLMKSALLTRFVNGPIHGYDKQSITESWAARFYDFKHAVAWEQHAVTRIRELFALALGYEIDIPKNTIKKTTQAADSIEFGLQSNTLVRPEEELVGPPKEPYLLFLHGSTWDTKYWPETYWKQLADQANKSGYSVLLPYGNDEEKARAQRICADADKARVLPFLSLATLSRIIWHSRGVIGVDSGLMHLANALGVPLVALYGATGVEKVGPVGSGLSTLSSGLTCSPCYSKRCHIAPKRGEQAIFPPCTAELLPQQVWATFLSLIQKEKVKTSAADQS